MGFAALLALAALLVAVRADLSIPRYNLAAAAANNYIIFAGGTDGTNFYNAIDLYDTIISAWSSSPAVGNLSAGVANLVGGNLPAGFLFVGGSDGLTESTNVDLWDTSSRTITPYPPLAVGRSQHAAASAGGVFACAGGNSLAGAIATVSFWDSRNGPGSWNETLSLSTARFDLAAASAGSHIVFAGGTAGGFFSASAEVLDVSSMSFIVTGGLSKPRSLLAGAGASTTIVFAGGVDQSGWLADVDIYSIATGQFTAGPPLSLARSDMAAVTMGTKLIFAGGRTANGFSDLVEIFDIEAMGWTVFTRTLSIPRSDLAAAASSSVAIFAGGRTAQAGNAAVGVSDIITLAELSTTATAATGGGPTTATGATGGGATGATDVTATASTAASFSTTTQATATGAVTVTTGTRFPAPPTTSPTYIVEGNQELNTSWTAPSLTIFRGVATSTASPRLTVDGGAFLGGKAQVQLPAPTGDPFKLRLVGAYQIVGAFDEVTVTAPKDSNCYKYEVTPVTPVFTFYTISVVPKKTTCSHIDHPWLWSGVALGAICLIALCVFLVWCYMKGHRAYSKV